MKRDFTIYYRRELADPYCVAQKRCVQHSFLLYFGELIDRSCSVHVHITDLDNTTKIRRAHWLNGSVVEYSARGRCFDHRGHCVVFVSNPFYFLPCTVCSHYTSRPHRIFFLKQVILMKIKEISRFLRFPNTQLQNRLSKVIKD